MLSGSTQDYHRGGGVFGLIAYLVIFGIYAVKPFSFTSDASNPITGEMQNQVATYVLMGGGLIFALIILYYTLKAIYIHFYIRDYFYDADDSFITIRKGVSTPAEIHVQWQKVQDVYVDQDFLDRLLGIYDVHIATATIGSAIGAHIDGVDKGVADCLKQYILTRVQSGSAALGNISTVGAQQNPQSAPSVNLQEVVGKSSEAYPLTRRWLFLWRQLFRFEFMQEYLLFKSGIISREEKHVLYRSVQDVIVAQTFWGRILGIATVKIQNAAGNGIWGTAVIPGLASNDANAVAELLRKVSLGVSAARTGL
jgi:membrane protein YdbS with pleckstrin-like domain